MFARRNYSKRKQFAGEKTEARCRSEAGMDDVLSPKIHSDEIKEQNPAGDKTLTPSICGCRDYLWIRMTCNMMTCNFQAHMMAKVYPDSEAR
jgi:hypothetical protein